MLSHPPTPLLYVAVLLEMSGIITKLTLKKKKKKKIYADFGRLVHVRLQISESTEGLSGSRSTLVHVVAVVSVF